MNGWNLGGTRVLIFRAFCRASGEVLPLQWLLRTWFSRRDHCAKFIGNGWDFQK